MRPAQLHRWIGRLFPEEHRETVLGDLAEEWEDRRARHGAAQAWRLYLLDAATSLIALRWAGAAATGRRAVVDLRLASRTLLRRPLLSLAVVLSLALGIGACAGRERWRRGGAGARR